MKELFKNKYRIESKRLQSWNYSRRGSYFITICTKDRLCRFGEMENGCLTNQTNKNIVLKYWNNLPQHYHNIKLGEIVVMPDHIHFIITILNNDAVVDDVSVNAIHELHLQKQTCELNQQSQPPQDSNPRLYQRRKMLLSKIIGRLKMQVAKEINAIEQTTGQPFWQRNYYDRIIRDHREYYQIRQYIRSNPANWEKDRNNENSLLMQI